MYLKQQLINVNHITDVSDNSLLIGDHLENQCRDLIYTDTLPYHYSEVEVDYNKSVEASIHRNKRSHSSVEAQLNAVKKAIDSVQGLSDGSQAYIYHFADDFMDE